MCGTSSACPTSKKEEKVTISTDRRYAAVYDYVTIKTVDNTAKEVQLHSPLLFYRYFAVPSILILTAIVFVAVIFTQGLSITTPPDKLTVWCDESGQVRLRNSQGEFDYHGTYGTGNATTQISPVVDPHWDIKQLFGITLAFGGMSFARVKTIDAIWDLVVGRGGQLLLIALAYPILRRSLNVSMGRAPVHVRTYSTIAFSGVSLSALWATTGELVSNLRLTRKEFSPLVLGQFLVVAYALAFPTITSVMTGYTPILEPWVLLNAGQGFVSHAYNKMPVQSLQVPTLVIVDGSRIGLRDNYAVSYEYSSLQQEEILRYSQYFTYSGIEGLECPQNASRRFIDCSYSGTQPGSGPPVLLNNTFEGFRNCSLEVECGHPETLPLHPTPWNGPSDETYSGREVRLTSTWFPLENGSSIHLEAPPLTVISQKFEIIEVGLKIVFPDVHWLSFGDLTFDAGYLRAWGECQPWISDSYQWGFSSLLLFGFCLLTLLFMMILFSLHVHAVLNTRRDRLRDGFNFYKDAFDLVFGLIDTPSGSTMQSMSAKDLKKEIEQEHHGISVDTATLPRS